MKKLFFKTAIVAVTLSACGNNNPSTEAKPSPDSSTTVTPETATTTESQNGSVDEAVTAYLNVKNALTTDDSKQASAAGKQLQDAMLKLDNASFAAEQKKVYDEVKDEIKEHAVHISTNADKIAHQREHFDMLSNDMYDLVKSVKPSQALYKDHCPMFNDNKGAIWLSEVEDIKNPYYGKKMLTCGVVKEEIK